MRQPVAGGQRIPSTSRRSGGGAGAGVAEPAEEPERGPSQGTRRSQNWRGHRSTGEKTQQSTAPHSAVAASAQGHRHARDALIPSARTPYAAAMDAIPPSLGFRRHRSAARADQEPAPDRARRRRAGQHIAWHRPRHRPGRGGRPGRSLRVRQDQPADGAGRAGARHLRQRHAWPAGGHRAGRGRAGAAAARAGRHRVPGVPPDPHHDRAGECRDPAGTGRPRDARTARARRCARSGWGTG